MPELLYTEEVQTVVCLTRLIDLDLATYQKQMDRAARPVRRELQEGGPGSSFCPENKQLDQLEDIHGPQMMSPNFFGHPATFPAALPSKTLVMKGTALIEATVWNKITLWHHHYEQSLIQFHGTLM